MDQEKGAKKITYLKFCFEFLNFVFFDECHEFEKMMLYWKNARATLVGMVNLNELL